jgi:hypothetical protein
MRIEMSANYLAILLICTTSAWDVSGPQTRNQVEAQQRPPPTFWMHQFEGADPKLLLCENHTRLNVEVGKLL